MNTEVATAAPAGGLAPVLPLTQAQKDKIAKDVDRELGDHVAGMVDEKLKNRDELLQAQFETTAANLAAERAYEDTTGQFPVLGALFWALAKEGREGGGTSLSRGKDAADRVAERFKKAAGSRAKTINLAVAGEGGLLVEGTVLELWLEPLRAMSVVLGLQPEMVPVTGDQFKVTGWETDPVITWVEEINTLDLTTTPADGERETPMRKAMAIMPVSADYRESASPAIFTRLQDMMRMAFATGFDDRLINGSGLNNIIAGLRTLITATSAATGTGTLANVLDDVAIIFTSVENSNIRPISRRAWIMAPRTKNHLMFIVRDANDLPFFLTEMTAGTFMGFPFGSTTNVPTNLNGTETVLIHQAMSQFLVGQSTALDVQWFQNASYTDAGSLVSTIERDTEVLRGRQKIGTLLPRGNSGYLLTAVPY